MRRLICFAALICATSVAAEPAKLTVDFGFFPKGTTCSVHGTTGKVRLKTGREIEYSIKGDTGNVSFRCQQPDGSSFTAHTGPLLPQGSPRLVAIQINQDNHAHVLWSAGGIQKSTIPGVLRWD